MNDVLIPKVGVVTDVRQDTPDVKTFRVVTPDGKKHLNICRDSVPCFLFRV